MVAPGAIRHMVVTWAPRVKERLRVTSSLYLVSHPYPAGGCPRGTTRPGRGCPRGTTQQGEGVTRAR